MLLADALALARVEAARQALVERRRTSTQVEGAREMRLFGVHAFAHAGVHDVPDTEELLVWGRRAQLSAPSR
jgi:hypothetical protein